MEKEHKDHNFEFNKIAAHEIERNLLENSCLLKLVTANIPIAIKDILATKQEVEAEEDVVANSIQTSFNEIHQILDKWGSKILVEALRNLQDNEVTSIHIVTYRERWKNTASQERSRKKQGKLT